MVTQKWTGTFDGVNDVPRLPGQSDVEWFDARISYFSVWYELPGPGDDLKATARFTGSDWRIKTLQIASENHHTTFSDVNDNTGRRIDTFVLGYNSDVDLISTDAQYIYGWDGDKHDVMLGDSHNRSVSSIELYAMENIVTTGNQWVRTIKTGGADNITIGSGGAGFVETGDGKSKVTTIGSVESIKTRDDDDIVNLGDGAVSVRTRGGNDKVNVNGTNDVDVIITSDGNDIVNTKTGGAGFVRTDDGNDKVTTGTGWVDLIKTGDGNDTVIVGTGSVGLVRLGDGDDLVRVSQLGPDGGGYQVNGGGGSDTLDFSKFNNGVTFTLDGLGVYQNVTAPGSLTGGQGWFGETGIDNIIGTKKGDHLTGDAADNRLIGKGGNDQLFGGDSDDTLKGDGGNDKLFGGAGKDSLIGGKGSDVLEGGKGNDTLRGNGGADFFVFGNNSGTDKVQDFADGTDTLRIADHAGGFGGLSFANQDGNLKITHDGGVILLIGEAGTTLTASDFDFV